MIKIVFSLLVMIGLMACGSQRPWDSLNNKDKAVMAGYDCESATYMWALAKGWDKESHAALNSVQADPYDGIKQTQVFLVGPNNEEMTILYREMGNKDVPVAYFVGYEVYDKIAISYTSLYRLVQNAKDDDPDNDRLTRNIMALSDGNNWCFLSNAYDF